MEFIESWLVIVEWLSRLVLLGLILLSVWSVSLIINRYSFFNFFYHKEFQNYLLQLRSLIKKKNISELKNFPDLASAKDDLSQGLRQYLDGPNLLEQKEALFDEAIGNFRERAEKGLSIIGTLGATSPYIGLFGTVLGIIVSFGKISGNQSDMNGVMFSLAESLILTAMGLLVAIPAVIANNYFQKKLRNLLKAFNDLKNDLFIHLYHESEKE